MPALLARLRVVASAAVTYLVAISAVLTVAAEELGTVAGVPETVTQLIARALIWIATAVTIIRRVTPVVPSDIGLLPPDRPVAP